MKTAIHIIEDVKRAMNVFSKNLAHDVKSNKGTPSKSAYTKMFDDNFKALDHDLIVSESDARGLDERMAAYDEPEPEDTTAKAPYPHLTIPVYREFTEYHAKMRAAGWTLLGKRAFACTACGSKAKFGKWVKNLVKHEACTNSECERYLPHK